MTRAIRAILGKELRELWRDPLSLMLALVLPFVMLMLFTYGLNLDVQPVRLGFYDLDRSATSRDYLASLSASDDLRLTAEVRDPSELRDLLDRRTVEIALIIGPDFERTLHRFEPAQVQVIVDGSFPTQARAALARLDAATAFYNQTLAAAAGVTAPAPAATLGPRVWFNPDLKSVNYIVPGLFSLILMVLPPLLSTLAVVREREHGSIQQILTAPVSPAAFILGKALPYGLVGFVQMLMVVAIGLLWFQVPFRGSLALYLPLSVIYIVGAVGLGLFISTVTRSQVVAMLTVLVVTLMPSMLFSGFLFPVFSMPARYQVLAQIIPARHFTEIARGLALKAVGLDQLWPHVLALLALAVVMLLLAIRRFHRRMA